MEERNYKVYMHINKINNKRYVGLTCQELERRWENGYGYLLKNKEGMYRQPLFARAILKYGWDGFEHIIIANNLTKKEAEQMEIDLISQYNTTDKRFGYNIREGGNTTKLSEDTKAKISMANKGKHAGKKNQFYNKHHSDDTKKLIGKKAKERYKNGQEHPMLGKHHSDETKQKIRESRLGKKKDAETKLKIKETRDCKQVVQLNKGDYVLIEIHRSILDASKRTNIPVSNIVENCKYRRKSAGGYKWMYLDEYERWVA